MYLKLYKHLWSKSRKVKKLKTKLNSILMRFLNSINKILESRCQQSHEFSTESAL